MSIYDKASLVLIPSGTKTSKVFSQKPVNGDGDFTFSRSTAATRVNADGNIEKETQNSLRSSNTFNSIWSASVATIAGGQSGYDGSNDAWLLSKTGNAYGSIYQTNTLSTGVWNISVYMKAGTNNKGSIRLSTGGANDIRRQVNLTTGAIATASASTANPIAESATDVGGGWWRFSFCGNMVTSSITINIYAGDTADTTGNIYIQDAQLEQGLVARDYIETTTAAVEGGITDNVPRLDYTDSSCPALLLEPQRTNLITSSEALSIGTSGSTTEQNTADTTSPEGYYNATKILGSTSYLAKGVGSAFSGNNTTSVFLKYGNDSEVGVYMYDGAYYRVIFDLTDGTISSTFGGATGTITDYGNGWYRCTIYKSTAANVVEVGVDGLAGFVYTYGWQHEYNASYATSYIPTYGTSVTRERDFASGRSDMQDFLGTNEGTWFMQFKDMFFDITGTGQGSINLVLNTGQQIEFIQSGNLNYKITLNNSTAVSNLDNDDKVAISWGSDGLVIYVNGESKYSTSSTIYSVAYYYFELTRIDRVPRVDMKQLLFFPTRLSNEELADLTTL